MSKIEFSMSIIIIILEHSTSQSHHIQKKKLIGFGEWFESAIFFPFKLIDYASFCLKKIRDVEGKNIINCFLSIYQIDERKLNQTNKAREKKNSTMGIEACQIERG